MRFLLTHHSPLRQSAPGEFAWRSAESLEAAGHQVRLLIADNQHHFGEAIPVERVVCGDDPNADLLFALPRFSSEPAESGRPMFAELSDAQLARYRDCLRRRLDRVIMHFDPHVIHVQHIWIFGQLALESGVPYVISAWEAELDEYERDSRFRPLAEQAAENASRIFVPDARTAERVQQLFEPSEQRLIVLPAAAAPERLNSDVPRQALAAELQAAYQSLLNERFG